MTCRFVLPLYLEVRSIERHGTNISINTVCWKPCGLVFYACAAPVGVMCRWLGTFVQISTLVAVSFVTLVVIQLLTHSLEMYDLA